MPNWYYDKKELKQTPSIRDGLDFETDRRYRKEGARFIIECGTEMGLGHNTMATGVVYFHRFYVFHSFKSFPRYVTACCCLFLAGKVEETPKKCRDIIRMARTMLTEQKFVSFGEDPKEEVMTLERILLQTIKFDLQVEHPYRFILKYAKCLKGDQQKRQKMVQMAWNFVNDSLSTTVCLQWEPEIIAVALIHLASKLSKFSVTKWEGQQPAHLRWWDMFVADVTMEILEDICHQVLDLYQQPSATDVESPPQLPPSKASPPAKRAKLSAIGGTPAAAGTPPVFARHSPSVGGGVVLAGQHQAPPPPPTVAAVVGVGAHNMIGQHHPVHALSQSRNNVGVPSLQQQHQLQHGNSMHSGAQPPPPPPPPLPSMEHGGGVGVGMYGGNGSGASGYGGSNVGSGGAYGASMYQHNAQSYGPPSGAQPPPPPPLPSHMQSGVHNQSYGNNGGGGGGLYHGGNQQQHYSNNGGGGGNYNNHYQQQPQQPQHQPHSHGHPHSRNSVGGYYPGPP